MRTYLRVKGKDVAEVAGEVVREQPLSVYVNGEKFLTLLCSPMGLEDLIVGLRQLIIALRARVDDEVATHRGRSRSQVVGVLLV